MRSAGVAGLLLAGVAACNSSPAPEQHAAPAVVPVRAAPTGVDASSSAGDVEHGADASAVRTDVTASYETARPTGGKSIGHTSVVLKLKLEGGLEAAYKPRSKRGPLRYKGEIAAYRLATALGLVNVPRALPRALPLAALIASVGGKDTAAGELLVNEAIPDGKGDVPGALIPWIPHLDFLALEADPLLSEWKRWLHGEGDIPPEKRALAGQISTLIVFDYVTGNWDRWSGGNIGLDKEHGTVLFIDNDGAFYDVPPPGPLAAQRVRLAALTRFSRTFVEHLRTLDLPALGAAMGDDDGAPLLSRKSLAGVMARKDDALQLIDARVKMRSAAATLSFD